MTAAKVWPTRLAVLTVTRLWCGAQAAVLRKEGRMQVSGPSINIPKKQLRAQWPEILDAHGPTDVTAHIFVDTADKYMSCAARITFTKAKVRG